MAVSKEGTALGGGAATSSAGRSRARTGAKLGMPRLFTRPGVHPFDETAWETRSARITNEKGETVFEQPDVEVPAAWSQMATNVVVSKYFHGQVGSPERETSVRQVLDRVARTISGWGRKDRYFDTETDAASFHAELTHILLTQKAAFNSPVWFNVGVEPKPQCSACFINAVEDTMESILTLAKTEGMLFKYGSGTGSNLSPLRSSKERLSTGGTPSGPVSFMKGYDAFAGVIRSGGRTRRAAKMVILNADHPDIVDFIRCKMDEERKAWALIDAGYDGSFNGEAYASIFFQNSNNSVRVTDEFMRAYEEGGDWWTRAVTTGEPLARLGARELMGLVAESAWVCGDPGMQFDTTVNEWNPCINSARINASNPCSEYMFLDDSACNLASINLLKFRRTDGSIDIEAFDHTVDVMITAMEILVGNSSYPTEAITRNSHDFRPLGLGYANLGAYLMSNGIAYDSDRARAVAAAITALLCGRAYRRSAELAAVTGPFARFPENRDCFLRVMRKHAAHVEHIDREMVDGELLEAARAAWTEAVELGELAGFRNAQTTVLAPTGTIAFMMDCDTTGVEPDIALVKYKKLVGGGVLKIVNNTVPLALQKLGYPDGHVEDIIRSIDATDTIEGAPHLRPDDLSVFDCAFKPARGERSIHYGGHIRMMAAVQPFLSGAISKTVNMPPEATPEEIEQIYVEAWKLGLKALAVYRDGCKRSQPLNTSLDEPQKAEAAPAVAPVPRAVRRRLPDERQAITHKFSVGGHDGYITVGMYEDGLPGEIFIVMAKEGSIVSGLMDSFATGVSLALQYGVPLEVLVRKFVHSRFEPAGMTNNPQIPMAKSVMDYIFRWLALKFLPEVADEVNSAHRSDSGGPVPAAARGQVVGATDAVSGARLLGRRTAGNGRAAPPVGGDLVRQEQQVFRAQADAPPCSECGAIMVRNGACYKCLNCGLTSGCS